MPKPFAHVYYVKQKHFLGQRAVHSEVSFPKTTFAPGQVCVAYQFPSKLGTPVKKTIYGIISLGGDFSPSDIAVYCAVKGWPVPNLTVIPVGGVTITSDPNGANVENMSDVEMILQAWHTAYPTEVCDIIAGVGPNIGTGIAQVAQVLHDSGVTDMSCSWGAAEPEWASSDRAATESVWITIQTSGGTIEAASGDSSLDDNESSPSNDYPSGSANVWSVGGTNLSITNTGTYLSEKAWGDGLAGDEGGGGGYDAITPIPAWQVGVVAGTRRGSPDSSANCDPNSGYQVYCDGAWIIIGGTSLSSPLTCGLFGVIRAMGGNLSNYRAALYAARKTAFRDIILGSNGSPAVAGYDIATGNGSPNGPGIVAALSGAVTPPPPPPPVQPPSTIVYATFVTTKDIPAGSTVRITN